MEVGFKNFKFRIERSLRIDLFIIICLAGILPGIIVSTVILDHYERKAVDSRIRQVQNQCLIISNHLYMQGYPDVTDNTLVDPELTQLSNLYDGRVMIINSDLKIVKDTYSLSEGKYMISEEVVKGLSGESASTYDGENHYIEIITPISDLDMKHYVGVMLTSVSTEETDLLMEDARNLCTMVQAALAMVVIGIAFYVTARIAGQFKRLSGAIENIREGFAEEEIDTYTYKETAQIKEAYNHLLLRMKNLDNARGEFVANVSHELKTPITSIKILAESLTAQNDVPNEIYREFMDDIVAEVDREDKIINDLLSLVKMDRAGSNLVIEKCDIDMMLEGIIKRLAPIADREGVELIFETIRPVIAEVDETKLTLAFTNIIENGIKYNHRGGTVIITLDSEPMMFTVSVADSGIGIPEEDIPHIFERFYRVDKSHSREIGGTGLGLAIARAAILMHKGAVKVESTAGSGSRFDIKIPLSYIVSPVSSSEQSGTEETV